MQGHGGHDQIDGNGSDDTIYGGTGNDVLNGGDGADSIYGGEGSDVIVGGDGPDDLYDNGCNDASECGPQNSDGTPDVLDANDGNNDDMIHCGPEDEVTADRGDFVWVVDKNGNELFEGPYSQYQEWIRRRRMIQRVAQVVVQTIIRVLS